MADSIGDIDEVRDAAGREILDLTDRFGFDAFAAGWLHDRASGAWRYLLVTPMLGTRGPRWVYERLLSIFKHNPLPPGVSPLDIYVIDPSVEGAVFGQPIVGFDERTNPSGLNMKIVKEVWMDDFFIADGFVAFYRRLPSELRDSKHDPARRFDLRVRKLRMAA